jgi:hypothetical protein
MTAVVPDIIYAVVFGTMVIFGVKYISAIFQAWALGAHDKQYRALAEKVVLTQAENQAALTAMQADLSRISSSLGEIEKILKQVD